MSFDQTFDMEQNAYESDRFGESLEEALAHDSNKSRIFLMGTRRSGKSSIAKVVFHKMSPHETLFLESTNDVQVRDIARSALVQFQLYDFPGSFDFADRKTNATPQQIFGPTGALVFVIDAQDEASLLKLFTLGVTIILIICRSLTKSPSSTSSHSSKWPTRRIPTSRWMSSSIRYSPDNLTKSSNPLSHL
jgi:hypothetical protein